MFDEMRAELDGLAEQYEKVRTQIGDVQRKVGRIRVTAESADGAVKATADYRGRLVDVALDPRGTRRLDSRTLSAAVVEAANAAADRAAAQAQEMFAALVPDEFADKLDLGRDLDLDKLIPPNPLGPVRLPGGEVL